MFRREGNTGRVWTADVLTAIVLTVKMIAISGVGE
jgi:hypothetical protein